jgi:hypothetical protein
VRKNVIPQSPPIRCHLGRNNPEGGAEIVKGLIVGWEVAHDDDLGRSLEPLIWTMETQLGLTFTAEWQVTPDDWLEW